MSRKILPYVVLCVSAIFSCKNTGIDYSMLDDDGYAPSGAWGMVDLQLRAPINATDGGRVLLHLSEHMSQDSNVRGADLSFVANGTLNFGAPDANNEATLDDEDISISMIALNLVNGVDKRVCPDNPVVAKTRVPDDSEDIIFSATDLACSGNKLVGMSALARSIDSLTEVPAHVWYHKHEEVLNKVDKFYQEEKQKGEQGALHKTQDPDINAAIDDFLIRRKMLKGYSAMHTELEKHAPLAEMKSQVQTNAKDSDKQVVIPATLNAFLDVKVNNRVIPDDNTGKGRDIDMLLLQGAVGNAVVKFLQYDHLFQFAGGETMSKFQQIKSQLPDEIRPRITEIEQKFNEIKSEDNVYTSASEAFDPLSTRLTCMNTFLTQQKNADRVCEDILAEFYRGLTSLSCGDDEVEDSDVFMLLTNRKVMEATKLYDVCDKYTIKLDKFNQESLKIIEDGVADMKASAIESMADLLKIYGQDDFRVKLLQNHFYAAVPVITEHPDKAGELATALAAAHENIYNKRKTDEWWQEKLGWLNTFATIVGLASLPLIWFPPVAGLASIAAAIAMGAGIFLAASHGKDWFHEKGDYAALEKAIYSGGQGDVAGLADTMQEWKAAKRTAIWEGVFTAVGGASGARRLITDPRAVATSLTPKNLGGSLKGSLKGLKVRWNSWREANTIREYAKTPKGIEEINEIRRKIAGAQRWIDGFNKALAKNRIKIKDGVNVDKFKLQQTRIKGELEAYEDVQKEFQRRLDRLIPPSEGRLKKVWRGIVDGRDKIFRRVNKRYAAGKVKISKEAAEEAGGFFKRSIEKIKEIKLGIYGLNREGWKARHFTKEMRKFAKEVKVAGGGIRWKFMRGTRGETVIKVDGGEIIEDGGKIFVKIGDKRVAVPENVARVGDFKLGADGIWVAVLSAERLDEWFLGDRGKRFIEGRVPLIGDRMFQ